MNIRFGEKKVDVLKAQSISGFKIKGYFFYAGGGGTVTNLMYDLTKILCKITRTINGEEIAIYNDSIKGLLKDSTFGTMLAVFVDQVNSTTLLPTDSTDNTKAYIFPSLIDFKGVLNISASEELRIEISVDRNFCNASVDAVSSYIEVEPIEAVGLEYFTPKITVLAIPTNESSYKKSIGGNIHSILLANEEGSTSIGDSHSSPFSKVVFSSDKLRYSYDEMDLSLLRMKDFERSMGSTYLDSLSHNYLLTPKDLKAPLQDVKLDITLVSANVVTNQSYIVVRELVVHPEKIKETVKKEGEHKAINAHHLLNGKGNCKTC